MQRRAAENSPCRVAVSKASPTPTWLFRRAIWAILNWYQAPRLRSERKMLWRKARGQLWDLSIIQTGWKWDTGIVVLQGKGRIRGNGRRQSECWCTLATSYFSQQPPTKKEWTSFHSSQAASQMEGITASLGETFSPCGLHSKLTESLVTCSLIGRKKPQLLLNFKPKSF